MRAVQLLGLCSLALAGAETLYEVLGVQPTASAKEIRTAYRQLALKLHPDKQSSAGGSGFADTTERFIKVSEAYATLSDGAKRARYDASQKWQWPGGGSGSSSHGTGSSHGAAEAFAFSFSLADAFDVLEKFLRSYPALQQLADSYLMARQTLEKWPGFKKPLPELLANGGALLQDAFDAVDWTAVAGFAKRALVKNFEREDGSVHWGKVAAAAGAGFTAVAAALDANDDGNRTQTIFSMGETLLGALNMFAGKGKAPPAGPRRPPQPEPHDDEL